jgi:hypothetical protein
VESDDEDTVIRAPRRDHPVAVVEGPDGAGVDDADTLLVTRPHAVSLQAASVAPVSTRHYRFQVNSHEPIALDRPAHIGRRPSLPRVPQAVRPRLVRVPSPLQEVSSTHLELRQQGASVVVTDLRSTNGTIVTMPGAVARVLRPGESLVVTPGTIIDLGDGNRIEILPLQSTPADHPHTAGAE